MRGRFPILGISTAAFFPRSLEKIFAILKEQPLRELELMPQAPSECRPDFARELAGYCGDEFHFCAIHFPSILQAFFTNPYPAAQEYGRQLCHDVAALAGALRADVIVVHAPWERMSSGSFLETTIENLRVLCDAAAEHGVTVGLENLVSAPLVRTPQDLLSFAARIDHPNLGFVLDITHAHETGQDPLAFVEQVSPLVHIHASDFDPSKGQHRVPGDGIVRWKRLAEGLRRVDFCGQIVMELVPGAFGDDPSADLRRGAEFLEEVF